MYPQAPHCEPARKARRPSSLVRQLAVALSANLGETRNE